MNHTLRHFSAAVASLLLAVPAAAQLYESGSTGVLGPLAPTQNITINLPEDGVLHYTTIDIPAGVTVKFRRNAENTPVYLLASDDVTIAGIIDASGTIGSPIAGLAGITVIGGQGGPGASDGGSAAGSSPSAGIGPGAGFGAPGKKGGGGSSPLTDGGYPGGAAPNAGGAPAYSDAGYQFLHGGSGGGAGPSWPGGGGGGVIVIASSTTITLTGSVLANGGSSYHTAGAGGGGVIRLAAEVITGTGILSATGNVTFGEACNNYYAGGCGGDGVIRVEAYDVSGTFLTKSIPGAFMAAPIKAVPYPSSTRPKLTVTAIAGKSPYIGTYFGHTHQTPGVSLPVNSTVTVQVTANNVPIGYKVKVTVNTVGQGRTTHETSALEGTLAESTATVDVPIPAGVKIGTIEAWIPNVPLPK